MSTRYEAGLVSHGASVPNYPTKAAAIKAAKDCARENPGRLVKFYSSVWKRGAAEPTEEQRFFRCVDGKVVEES